MIQVGNSGLFFDGGRKGNFEIIFLAGKVFKEDRLIYGSNVDCTGEIFRAIKDYGIFKINQKRFLENHEWLIKECFKKQLEGQEAWSMGKCYDCGINQKCNEAEEEKCNFPLRIASDWGVRQGFDEDKIIQNKSLLTYNNPCISLKDFDLRSEYVYGLHMVAKLKSVKNPVVKKGKYIQWCELYDEDTNKTIECKLDNNVADFDKWHNRDTVETWGIYERGFYTIVSMDLIEVDTSEPVTVNRNSETPGYNEWRNTIVNRDKKCVCCGYDKHLEAHHLFGYKENSSLAVNEFNGITLCKFCHDKYHSVYGLRDINPVDFVDFIKRFGVR